MLNGVFPFQNIKTSKKSLFSKLYTMVKGTETI